MEFAVSLSAICRMSSCLALAGLRSVLIMFFTSRRRSTSFLITCGRTTFVLSASVGSVGAGGGALGSSESHLGCATVVKQMLYSWMMDGYSELKSIISTYLSYKPFLGSSTRPPA